MAIETESVASPPSRYELTEPGSFVRVVTFNVNGIDDGRRLARAFQEDETLRAADVFLLQEIETSDVSHGPRELGASLGYDVAYATSRRQGSGSHGVAILCRVGLHDVEVVSLPRFNLGYRSRRRIALTAWVPLEDQALTVVNVHLDTRLRLDDRVRQVEPAVRRAGLRPPAVVGGDFNTIRAIPFLLPWIPLPLPGTTQARAFDFFMEGRGFEKTIDAGVVRPTGPLGMELDALYHLGLETAASGTIALPGLSDHRAVWADLRIPEASEGDTR